MSCFALVAWAALCATDTGPYAWPLDLPKVITSSFGEYRARRFHMGIDLRTGPSAKEVHAAGDGYVSRIRASPYGYGKAVYLQLDDGRSVVYAHLSDFAAPLREYMYAEQHARKRYSVDLYLPRDTFPVKKGDVIARSGQTGIGVPHLHYEIRDAAGAPVDPHSLGVRWPDSTPPLFRKLLVVPATRESTVNGDMMPQVLFVDGGRSGRFRAEPVRVRGSVFFGVDVIDPANGGSTRLGIYSLRTVVGDEEVFSMHNERITYEHDEDSVVAYHPYFLGAGRFLLQWRWNGNETESFARSQGSGVVYIGDEEKEVTIRAEDAHGNAATLTIPLVPDLREYVGTDEVASHGTGRVEVTDIGERLVVTAKFTHSESEMPVLIAETTDIKKYSFIRIDENTFRAAFEPLAGVREVLLSVAHPRIDEDPVQLFVAHRGDTRRTLRTGPVEIEVKPESPYGVMFLRTRETEVSTDSDLKLVGMAVEIWPEETPIDEPIGLRFRVPGDTNLGQSAAVYRRGKKSWQYMGGKMEDGRLAISTKRLGTFAVMVDVKRPSVYSLRPREGTVYEGRRPHIRATIEDAGSGIAGYSARASGQWLLMEYDPERKLLEWARDEDLPMGTLKLVFNVRDAAGNQTEKSVRFTVSDN